MAQTWAVKQYRYGHSGEVEDTVALSVLEAGCFSSLDLVPKAWKIPREDLVFRLPEKAREARQ